MHVVFSEMSNLVIGGRASGAGANNNSLLNDRQTRVRNLHGYRHLRLHDVVHTRRLRRLGLLDVLRVVVFATQVKHLHVYIPHGCRGMPVLCGDVLNIHPLDPCHVTRAPLRVLHNDLECYDVSGER